MNADVHHLPRSRVPALPRLGLYLRVGRSQHNDMESALLLADGVFGLVIDPMCEARHADLMTLAKDRSIDLILDPRTQELALPGGWNERLGTLSWAEEDRPHKTDDFVELPRLRLVREIAEHIVRKGYTGVLSPSHYLTSLDDGWLEVDSLACVELRRELRRLGVEDVQIIYSLAVPYKLLREPAARMQMIEAVARSGADAVWLKVSGQGSEATGAGVRNYVAASSDFHRLGVPIIADHMGGLAGQALLAFGAVGGLSHGVTLKERFNANSWVKARDGGGFAQPSRVYVEQLGLCIKKAEAKLLYEQSRAKARLGCPDRKCCPRGVQDSVENPVRHAVRRRSEEIRKLSGIPASLRPMEFIHKTMGEAVGHAEFASKMNFDSTKLAKRLQDLHKSRKGQMDGLLELAGRFDSNKVSPLPLRFAERG